MSSFPLIAEPLTDGEVVLRDNAERDIPEILIAHQDDPRHASADGRGPAAERSRARPCGRTRGGRPRESENGRR